MIYKCGKCLFLFNRIEPPSICPDCGSDYINEANEAEWKEYEKLKEEFEN